MIRTEKDLRRWLLENAPGHWCRVEGSTASGIPDLSFSVQCGLEGWAELKVLHRHQDGWVHASFRPAQVAWIVDRTIIGQGRVVIVGLLGATVLFIPGTRVKELATRGLPPAIIAGYPSIEVEFRVPRALLPGALMVKMFS